MDNGRPGDVAPARAKAALALHRGRNDGRAAPVCSRAIIPQRDTVRFLLPLTLSLSHSRAEKRALSAGCSLAAPVRRVRPAFSFMRHSMRPYGSAKRSHGDDDVASPPNLASARLQPCGSGLPSSRRRPRTFGARSQFWSCALQLRAFKKW